MHFSNAIPALLALSTSVLAAAIPTENQLLARVNTPTGTKIKCGQVPNNPTLKSGDVHVWERVDVESKDLHGPGGKTDVDFHKDLNNLQDLIGGAHYDVLFGTVQKDLTFKFREVGLWITQTGWLKTHPSGEGAAFDIYNQAETLKKRDETSLEETAEPADPEEAQLDARDSKSSDECYYKGILGSGSAITSPTKAQTLAKDHYKGKTYKVGTNDCVTVSDWILSQMKFK